MQIKLPAEKVSNETAAEIIKAITQIEPDSDFIRHMHKGEETYWLDFGIHVGQKTAARCVDAAKEIVARAGEKKMFVTVGDYQLRSRSHGEYANIYRKRSYEKEWGLLLACANLQNALDYGFSAEDFQSVTVGVPA